MGSFRIDRERAARLVIAAILAVLALAFLPGLLRTPEPPPLPPDVGFDPSPGYVDGPDPGTSPPVPQPPAADRKHGSAGRGEGRHGRRPPARSRKRDGRNGKPRQRQRQTRRSPTGVTPASPAVANDRPASPPAAPVPPAPSPPPAPPPPAPTPSRPPPAGDGSLEFAPR